jgi:general L-amino acid transport system substrate-binding protein
MSRFLVYCIAALLIASPVLAQDGDPATGPAEPGPTLERVLARGLLVCAVNEDVFAYGFLNPNTGNITGINVDFCQAVSAAIFGDARATDLQLFQLEAQPSTVLEAGADLMIPHAIPQSFDLKVTENLTFGPTTFYDGQAIMVRLDSEIESWQDLNGETLCSVTGIPQTALENALNEREISYELVTFATPAEMNDAFVAGRCVAQSLDRSLLEILRATTPNPNAYTVWEEPYTQMRYGPIYMTGDEQWHDIVSWTLWGLIKAEELGIMQDNVDSLMRIEDETDDAYITRVGADVADFLDPTRNRGNQLGLGNDFLVAALRAVGNYGEIYERHLGPQSQVPTARSLNSLWAEGGLISSPVWR